MPIRLLSPTQLRQSEDTSSNSSSDIDDDQWNDWISDSNAEQECKSLFDDKQFPSVQAAAAYDKEIHHFVLDDVCKALCELLRYLSQLPPLIALNSIGFSRTRPTHQLHP